MAYGSSGTGKHKRVLSFKRSRCPHDRIYRERGPRQVSALVKDIPKDPDIPVLPKKMSGPVVIEVCECGWRREIGFKETMG